jgi:hypothetical protein
VPEKCFAVAIGVNRIRDIAQHSLDLFLRITGPPQNAFDVAVRKETAVLHELDPTPRRHAFVGSSRPTVCAPSRSPTSVLGRPEMINHLIEYSSCNPRSRTNVARPGYERAID